ncbi:MAG: T9SS type A sorting domain-containing protein, partial [Bacteroidales bacterium]|nr:T9SS type A sorting domain-containing protein [Bacteroidales bacterium]
SCTSADTSEWSLVRTFTTPSRVTLSSPSSGIMLSSLSTSLQWNSISGSTRYIYQYDVSPTFNTTHLISNTTSSYYTSISGLNYNTTYYWRVCAYNSVDTSDWSLVRTFRTGTLNMTATPTLVSPADGSMAIPADGQTFTWDAYPNAQSYEIEYSTYNDFSDNVGFQTVTATNTQLFGLDAHTTYYWRVRAANGVDFSPWSNAWSFTTENCSTEIYDIEDVTICESELPYPYRDTIFGIGTGSSTFQFAEVFAGVCDTIHHVTLNLTVNPTYTMDVYREICVGQLPYSYENTTFPQGTATGIYPLSYTTVNGCDSTVNLHLTVVDAINTAFSAVACGNYTWNDVTYTQSGIYTQNFVSSVGCDSIVSLDLTITSILYTNISVTACETYTWNGETYSQSGTYTQTLTSANNCDSIVTLDLTITHPVTETISVASCGSYLWNNQLYTVSGTYQQSFPRPNDCDSIVTLQLTINQPVTSQEDFSVCESDLPYTWNGIVFNEAGTETVTLTAANGCDSIVTLVLSVTEVNTDIYSLVMTTSVQGFADMLVEQQDAQYQWINCETMAPVASAVSSVFTPTEAGHYACIITYNNCTDTTECIEATLQGRVNDIDAQNLRIYPNPASDFVMVEGDALQQIQLFNMAGQMLNCIVLENAAQYQLSTAQLPAGAYLLRIATVDGEVAKMLIVE